ncbi:Gfo/Idh/MocA family oxidoreductase [Mesorhizobium sp. M0244]
MDFDDPATLEAGPTGGLLRDLGSHLVDQMLWLLGPRSVDAQLDHIDLPQGPTDASFTIRLAHENGVHSHISASKLNHLNIRELRAYGSERSYVSHGTDVQAQAIFAGRRPMHDMAGWGYEPEEAWGVLRTAAGEVRFPPSRAAITITTPPLPVPCARALRRRLPLLRARQSSTRSTRHD